MFTVYTAQEGGLRRESAPGALSAQPVWIDMASPSASEEAMVEAALDINIPTREELAEIEASSRLYVEREAVFMTATVLTQVDAEMPEAAPVTFVLAGDRLVTVRYSEPRSFASFAGWATRPGSGYDSAETVLVGLLDSVVDRTADVLEALAAQVDTMSAEVFQTRADGPMHTSDFHAMLRRIGRAGELNSKVRESLVSIGRLLLFLAQAAGARKGGRELRERVKTLIRDTHSLTDHASFIASKITFMLDATLGMINVEQNAIIKIFSVVAAAFLPPTLIASIYGMNFAHMPELGWPYGYPLALALMVLSAVGPFLYFKRRGWL